MYLYDEDANTQVQALSVMIGTAHAKIDQLLPFASLLYLQERWIDFFAEHLETAKVHAYNVLADMIDQAMRTVEEANAQDMVIWMSELYMMQSKLQQYRPQP